MHAKSRFVDKSSNWVTRKQGNRALSPVLVRGSEKTLCKIPVENHTLKRIIPPFTTCCMTQLELLSTIGRFACKELYRGEAKGLCPARFTLLQPVFHIETRLISQSSVAINTQPRSTATLRDTPNQARGSLACTSTTAYKRSSVRDACE